MLKYTVHVAIAICLAGPVAAHSVQSQYAEKRAYVASQAKVQSRTKPAGCPLYSTLPRAQEILERLVNE